MNYLAHLALSGNNESLIIGNFIGDSMQGIPLNSFDHEIQKGIKLHRFIDHFTDHHPSFIAAKRIFSSSYDKYSGVLIDIFFDHFLAIHFNVYFEINLQSFADHCYRIIQKKHDILPERAKAFFDYMISHNILFEYKELNSIKFVLDGLYHRIKGVVPIYESFELFKEKYQEIENLFLYFFPELKKESEQFILNL